MSLLSFTVVAVFYKGYAAWRRSCCAVQATGNGAL